MAKDMIKVYGRELDNLEAADLLKKEYIVKHFNSYIKIGKSKKEITDFTSDHYVRLNYEKDLFDDLVESLEERSFQSRTSRLITGTESEHLKLEKSLADQFGKEDCVTFNSYNLAMLGLFDGLSDEQDTIFLDALSSPLAIDGVRLARAQKFIYQNNDILDLEYHLKMSERSRFRISYTDSVFHQDGTLSNIPDFIKVSKKYNCLSVVDDSLGFGIIGTNGYGFEEYHELKSSSDLITGSFHHTLGIDGGFIAGPKDIISWLRHSSRAYHSSRPLTPFQCRIALWALKEVKKKNSEHLEILRSNIRFLQGRLVEESFEIIDNLHPIVNILTFDVISTQKIIDHLFKKGILVNGLCYPSVPQDMARIKIHLNSNHSEEDLDYFVSELMLAREKSKS